MTEVRIGDCRLIHGDALAYLPTLAPGSVDAVVTDPPYGMNFQSARRTESERFDRIANDAKPFVWWTYPSRRVVRDGGCVLTFCRWDDAEAFRAALDWGGFTVKSQLIWDRGNHGLGDLNGTPAPRHDTVWFAVNGGFKFSGRRPPSVLSHMRLSGDALQHPNEKPEALMDELVADYTAEGETVGDWFMGSGTTGVACVRLGRKFIGVEIDERYFAIACKRIEKTYADKANPLFGEVAPKAVQLALSATPATDRTE